MKILETNLYIITKHLIYLLMFLFINCNSNKGKEIINSNTNRSVKNEKKIELKIEKITEGIFMVEDYHEQFIIKIGNCTLKSPKSNDQVKYNLIESSIKQGDWNNDNNIDFEFMYILEGDGETLEIVYVIISNCKYNYIVSEFFYDEDSFKDNFDVSHISNIKNAKDYYIRNFLYNINHNSHIDNKLKRHMLEVFNKFVSSDKYKKL